MTIKPTFTITASAAAKAGGRSAVVTLDGPGRESPITFTIARSLIQQAAEQGCAIKVTVQGPRRILARLHKEKKG
jgi:hypothetical protein